MDAVLEKFLKGVKDSGLRRSIERIYLFGSRAKGTEKPNSDYDLLIVVRGNSKTNKNKEFREKIYDVVVDTLLETGRDISLKIFRKKEFNRLCRMETPFMRSVLKEGIRIG
ncbi:MAG: nucleotidyltransferase domain-containing protein [Candidatus Omnitrophota bacterium]